MPYQYVREPLTAEEADRLANACDSPTEKLVVWTLLDTGLRIGELCELTSKSVLSQQRQLRFKGKGGPYGKKTKIRVVPMSTSRTSSSGSGKKRPIPRRNLTNAALLLLGRLPRLLELNVRGTPVTDAGVAAFRKAHPNVQVFRRSTCRTIIASTRKDVVEPGPRPPGQ